MKISGRTDVQAPVEFVFDAIADFEFWERAAMRRGADVTRTDKLRTAGPGMSWMIRFGWRGRERQMFVSLKQYMRPSVLVMDGDSPSVEGMAQIELVPLSATKSRILVQTTIKPRTLAARLFIQSLRLARKKVNNRFDKKLQQLAQIIEQRHANGNRL